MDIDPEMVERLSTDLNSRTDMRSMASRIPKHFIREELYPSEDAYFKANQNVGGMAAEDNRIIMNRYAPLKPNERDAVMVNEATRLFLRNNNVPLKFNLTDNQKKALGNYSKDENDIRATIIGRIVSGDPSALDATPEQRQIADQIKGWLFKKGYGLE